MKFLKQFGIGILVLIAIFLVAAIFTPKSYTVSSEQIIAKDEQSVFDYIRFFQNQNEFNIWLLEDPNAKIEISGTDGEVGAIQAWDSSNDNVGAGEQEIIALSPGKIEIEIRFKRPFEGTSTSAYHLQALSATETMVQSEFSTSDSYPFNFFSYFLIRPMLKKSQSEMLQLLKEKIESKS
jgi:hypothetical protein